MSSFALTPGWHYVVFSQSASTFQAFVDGQRVVRAGVYPNKVFDFSGGKVHMPDWGGLLMFDDVRITNGVGRCPDASMTVPGVR